MIVSGTITQAGIPSEPTGQYQVMYQDVTITNPAGQMWSGRIGSKQGYQVNTPISVTVEEKPDGQGGVYLYFRKYNPQYPQQPSQGQPQQPRQAPRPAPQRPNTQQQAPNGKEMAKQDWEAKECRGHRAMCMAYAKDLVVAGKLEANEIDKWVKDKVTFIWDGITDRGGQPNPDYVGDDPPPPLDDGIPY